MSNYYDIVTRPDGGKKINKKRDENERLLKIPAVNLWHFFQRWLGREVPDYDARAKSLFVVREYTLVKRIGRTVVQFLHKRDYDELEIYETIRKKGKK